MKIVYKLLNFIYPPKCILCQKVLKKEETSLCHSCRRNAPVFILPKKHISFVAGWNALWYYKDDVRESLLRYKFHKHRSYASHYGQLLAMKYRSDPIGACDVLTYVPTGSRRKWFRGYDQVALLAKAMAPDMDIPMQKLLRKVRHTPPQSLLTSYAHRKANVLGAYAVIDPAQVAGKRILLLDDIITTGATASECAKTLLTAGAKEVYCLAVAAKADYKKQKHR